MSWIERYRLSFDKPFGMEAYFKIHDGTAKDDDGVMFKLAVDSDGIYYYGKYAHVLTDDEKDSTLASYYAFISMQELQEIFEALRAAKLHLRRGNVKHLTAKRNRRTVIIEKATETEDD